MSRSRFALGVLAALGVLLVPSLGACRAAAPATSTTEAATTTTAVPVPTLSSTTRPPPTTDTTAEGGKTGGVLKVGAGLTTSADPLLAATPTDEFVAGQVFEALTSTTGGGRVAPLLATSWTSSVGGSVWVFDLRPGVRFHDGRALEAADVVATFARLTAGSSAPEVNERFAGILTVRELDPARVEFALRTADPLFPLVVADPRAAIRARPAPSASGADGGAAGVAESGAGLIGTGPFSLRSFSPRDRAILVRNPDYWRDDGAGHALPYLDEVQVIFSPEVSTEVVALQGGELQLVMALTSELATTVALDRRLRLLIGPGATPFSSGGFAGVEVGVTGIVLAGPWQRTSLAPARYAEGAVGQQSATDEQSTTEEGIG